MGDFRENVTCNTSLLWRYDEVIWEYTCLRRYFCATTVLLSALSVFVLYLPPNTPREGHLSLRTYFLYQWPSHIPLFFLPQLDNQKIFLEAFPISNPCQSARWPILRSTPSSFPVPLPCYCPPVSFLVLEYLPVCLWLLVHLSLNSPSTWLPQGLNHISNSHCDNPTPPPSERSPISLLQRAAVAKKHTLGFLQSLSLQPLLHSSYICHTRTDPATLSTVTQAALRILPFEQWFSTSLMAL